MPVGTRDAVKFAKKAEKLAEEAEDSIGSNSEDDEEDANEAAKQFDLGLEKELTKSVLPDICPVCGNVTFVNIEGCKKCFSCGHSEC